MGNPNKKNAGSNKKQFIGKWSASLKTGRKAILVVRGVIPTRSEKQSFSLTRVEQPDYAPLVLVLELSPDLAVLDGATEIEVYYSEILDRYDQYKSVLIKGSGRELAFFNIEAFS